MANNGVLHELKVAIRVALSGYKKDMAGVKDETRKARAAVDSEMGKVDAALQKAGTGKARKEIEKLTASFDRRSAWWRCNTHSYKKRCFIRIIII